MRWLQASRTMGYKPQNVRDWKTGQKYEDGWEVEHCQIVTAWNAYLCTRHAHLPTHYSPISSRLPLSFEHQNDSKISAIRTWGHSWMLYRRSAICHLAITCSFSPSVSANAVSWTEIELFVSRKDWRKWKSRDKYKTVLAEKSWVIVSSITGRIVSMPIAWAHQWMSWLREGFRTRFP